MVSNINFRILTAVQRELMLNFARTDPAASGTVEGLSEMNTKRDVYEKPKKSDSKAKSTADSEQKTDKTTEESAGGMFKKWASKLSGSG